MTLTIARYLCNPDYLVITPENAQMGSPTLHARHYDEKGIVSFYEQQRENIVFESQDIRQEVIALVEKSQEKREERKKRYERAQMIKRR
jgi:hypothetical protein